MNVFDQLKRDEGLRLRPYLDTKGTLTIGYGHNLDATGINIRYADEMLQDDVAHVVTMISTELPWATNLNEARRGVLINMGFNLGMDTFLTFRTFLALVQKGDYDAAALDMLTTKWAKDVGPRAYRLSRQMRTGEWV